MDGLFVVDGDQNVTLINETVAALVGVISGDLTLSRVNGLIEILSPQGQLLPRDKWPTSLALCGVFVEDFEVQIRRKDTGVSTLVQITTLPISGCVGAPIQFAVTYRDITKRNETDAARGLSAAIVDSSDDAIIGKDHEGIVTSWNNGAAKIFGYDAAEMIGQPINRLLPQDNQNEEDEILLRLRRGDTVDHVETSRIRKDGRCIQVSLTISPIRDAAGNIVGASKIARDITAKKDAERRILQSQKLEAIGQLTGGVAHDFNNLLAIVIGALELLQPAIVGNEVATRCSHVAYKAAKRGADLTRRLLAFSSMKQFKFQPTQVNRSVRDMVELAARLVGPEIKFHTKLDESMPTVLTNQTGLESVLLNLAVNARDAMPRGGHITVATKTVHLENDYVSILSGTMKAGTYACIAMADTGSGMPKEVIDRAFEPFFTTKSRGRGTGLGLSMVYGFIKQSQGGVRIHSKVGIGTTISIYLPFANSESQVDEVATIEAKRGKRSGTVLIVDDEEDLVRITGSYLGALGYQTVTAKDGPEALQRICERDDIDVMLTDIIMSEGMDGVELSQIARELKPAMRIVYSSGFPADALSERNLSLANCLVLQKPYSLSELGLVIERAISRDPTSKPNAIVPEWLTNVGLQSISRVGEKDGI